MFYERNLPHWQPDKAEFFITFRLVGSLPKSAIEKIKFNKKLLDQKLSEQNKSTARSDSLSDLRKYYQSTFQKYEKQLDGGKRGPTWLANPDIAQIVKEAIHFRDHKVYNLYAYCIMPNHVHMVLKMLKENIEDQTPTLTIMLKNLKSYTAQQANKLLNRTGNFWQVESFDRVIRDNNERESTIRYVLYNPVKAQLTDKWEKWPYSYCKPHFKNDLL